MASNSSTNSAIDIINGMLKDLSISREKTGEQADGGGDKMEQQAQQLRREIEKLMGALAVKDPIIQQLSREHGRLKRDLPALEAANWHLVSENAALKEDLRELETVRRHCEEEHDDNRRLCDENARLRAENEGLTLTNYALDTENAALLQSIGQDQPAASQQAQDAMEE